MRTVQQWSFVQIVLVSVVWVVGILLLAAGYMYVQLRAQAGEIGSGGIGAVSGVLPLIVLLAVLGGPAALMTAWLLVRGRSM